MQKEYSYATLALGESLSSPTVCECCGREELKKTIKLNKRYGGSVWFGVGCAAKAMSLKTSEVEKARKVQVKAEESLQEDFKRKALDKYFADIQAKRREQSWSPPWYSQGVLNACPHCGLRGCVC